MAVERWKSSDGVDSFKLSDDPKFIDYMMMSCTYHLRGPLKERLDMLDGMLCFKPSDSNKYNVIFYLPLVPVVTFFAGAFKFYEIIPIPIDQHETLIERWKEGCLESITNFYDRSNERRRPFKKVVLQLMTAKILNDSIARDLEPLLENYSDPRYLGRRMETFHRGLSQAMNLYAIMVEQFSYCEHASGQICEKLPYFKNINELAVRSYHSRGGGTQWKVVIIGEDGKDKLATGKARFTNKDDAEKYKEHLEDLYAKGHIKPPKNG